MKIFLTSDIHTEHAHFRFNPCVNYQSLRFDHPLDADVIVLAGDIGERTQGLEWARNRFTNKEIVYVAGNHEFYESDLSVMSEMKLKAKEFGIHLLDNDSVVINGVRFLGTTLWSDFNRYCRLSVTMATHLMRDYEYIRCVDWWRNKQNREQAVGLMNPDSLFGFEPEFFSPTVAYLLHRAAINWLKQELAIAHNGKTVVVTHHSPSFRSSPDKDPAYASNLDDFIAEHSDKITAWFHGHIHWPVDYEIAGVRIVSNPRGYPKFGVSRHFDDGKIICL
ncbi:MAG TPA: metallophosphoesterase [Methylobacter sp.]